MDYISRVTAEVAVNYMYCRIYDYFWILFPFVGVLFFVYVETFLEFTKLNLLTLKYEHLGSTPYDTQYWQ